MPRKLKKDRREGPTYISMGSNGKWVGRLGQVIQESMKQPVREIAEKLFNEIYDDRFPGPGFGEFVGHAVMLGVAEMRRELAKQKLESGK